MEHIDQKRRTIQETLRLEGLHMEYRLTLEGLHREHIDYIRRTTWETCGSD